jgi:hypothetical protein
MSFSQHLIDAKVSEKPVDYEWDARKRNRILAADADTKPALAKKVGAISTRAAFAFSVAASEWVVARLSTKTDVTDAQLRIAAAWAATIDARYARLPLPEDPDDDDPDFLVADPPYLAMLLLSEGHKDYLDGKAGGVYQSALQLSMLAEHVAGRNAAFKKWNANVLTTAHKHYPKSTKPIDKQKPVAREVFDAGVAPPPNAQAKLLATLDPARNPYLVAAAALKAAGLASPYAQK